MAAGLMVIVLVAVRAVHGPAPSGSLVDNNKETVPLKFAAGVYVTVAGEEVCAVLLNIPPPETIDHAPVVAPPPMLAPDKVMAEGLAD